MINAYLKMHTHTHIIFLSLINIIFKIYFLYDVTKILDSKI